MRAPTYSPSKLAIYQTCPRQYDFQYVRKWPRRAWAAQSFGSSLHRTLQALHAQGELTATPLEEAQAQLSRSWSSAGFDDAQHEAAELARGRELLATYYASWAADPGKPVLLEARMSAPYGGITLLGIVDRVDRLPDGSLAVLDYKSGYAPETVPETVRQQLTIYHHLIRHRLGETPSHHGVHYLASNQRFAWPVDEDEVTMRLEGALATCMAIAADARFEPRPSARCGRCDYLRACEEGKRAWREASEQA